MTRQVLADDKRHREEIYRNESTRGLIVYRLTFKVPVMWLGICFGTKNVYFEKVFPSVQDSYNVDKIRTYCREEIRRGRDKKRKMRRNGIKFMRTYEENTI